jgi:hypothetical protein
VVPANSIIHCAKFKTALWIGHDLFPIQIRPLKNILDRDRAPDSDLKTRPSKKNDELFKKIHVWSANHNSANCCICGRSANLKKS